MLSKQDVETMSEGSLRSQAQQARRTADQEDRFGTIALAAGIPCAAFTGLWAVGEVYIGETFSALIVLVGAFGVLVGTLAKRSARRMRYDAILMEWRLEELEAARAKPPPVPASRSPV